MPKRQTRLDRLFQALSAPARRAVLERLGRGAASVSELARGSNMALPSFLQHLAVLERSGLVESRKVGRVRTYRLAPGGFDPAEQWLAAQRSLWERRLDQLDEYLKTMEDES